MSLANLWRVLAVALPALGALIANLPSVDLTYHLRAGEEILTTGSIPTTDTPDTRPAMARASSPVPQPTSRSWSPSARSSSSKLRAL